MAETWLTWNKEAENGLKEAVIIQYTLHKWLEKEKTN